MQRGTKLQHYQRAATRWKQQLDFEKEKATLIISPHIDDAFLSLYEFMRSGALGRNIIVLNVFTLTESEISTNTKLNFRTIRNTSIKLQKEELMLSAHLSKSGINYIPIFVGLKNAPLRNYYKFVFTMTTGRRPSVSADDAKRLAQLIAVEVDQLKKNVNLVLYPMGFGAHADHALLRESAKYVAANAKVGFYSDAPYFYLAGYRSFDSLCGAAPDGFKPSRKNFNPRTKSSLFKRIYRSQFNMITARTLEKIADGIGEVIFLKR